MLGCKLRDSFVHVDDLQQTSVPGIFCAGEPTGIGGLELALVEGEIAGLAAGGRAESAKRLFRERRESTQVRAYPRPNLCAAIGTQEFAAARDDGLPLRGCKLFPRSAASIVAHRQVAEPLRNGTMPGTRLRTHNPVPIWLVSRLSEAADFPHAFQSLAAMACQVQPEHSPVTGEHA